MVVIRRTSMGLVLAESFNSDAKVVAKYNPYYTDVGKTLEELFPNIKRAEIWEEMDRIFSAKYTESERKIQKYLSKILSSPSLIARFRNKLVFDYDIYWNGSLTLSQYMNQIEKIIDQYEENINTPPKPSYEESDEVLKIFYPRSIDKLNFEICVSIPSRFNMTESKDFYYRKKSEIQKQIVDECNSRFGRIAFSLFKCDSIVITRDHRIVYNFGRKKNKYDEKEYGQYI